MVVALSDCAALPLRPTNDSELERKNASAHRVKGSNPISKTRSVGAWRELLYRLRARDCTWWRPACVMRNQGGEHRKIGRPGAPWLLGDACTPRRGAREQPASVAAPVRIPSTCDGRPRCAGDQGFRKCSGQASFTLLDSHIVLPSRTRSESSYEEFVPHRHVLSRTQPP